MLATGSRPRSFPDAAGGALQGVHLIRGIDDIDRLQASPAQAARILVIGGGYIGLETGAAPCPKRLADPSIDLREVLKDDAIAATG